jgi:hypothetical protein
MQNAKPSFSPSSECSAVTQYFIDYIKVSSVFCINCIYSLSENIHGGEIGTHPRMPRPYASDRHSVSRNFKFENNTKVRSRNLSKRPSHVLLLLHDDLCWSSNCWASRIANNIKLTKMSELTFIGVVLTDN